MLALYRSLLPNLTLNALSLVTMSKRLIVIAFVAMAAILERGFVFPFGLSTVSTIIR